MRNSFGFIVLFVCHLLIKTILSDDNVANNLENNQSLNGQNQQVKSELTTITANSWPTKIRKSVLNNSSKQFVDSPLSTFNYSQTALYKYQEDTNEHTNNSLNWNGLNFDIKPTFWNFIEGKFTQSNHYKWKMC